MADLLVVVLVRVPAVGADLDERDPRLDQPAGQQAALAERVAAVGVAGRRALVVQLKGPHVGREDHPRRLGVEGAMIAHPVGPAGLGEPRRLEVVEQAEPALEAIGGDPRLGVVGRPLRVLDHERLEAGTQESRPDRRPADAHDVRQVELALAQLGGHRAAQVRVLEGGGRHVPGVKLVGGTLVVPLLVGHRPHQGDLLHDLGRLLPALGDRDARVPTCRWTWSAPPCSVPGLGSNVSSWLGPPAIQSRMQAICRFRSSSACRTIRSVKLTGIAPRPASPAAPQPSVLRESTPADDPVSAHSHLDDVRFDLHSRALPMRLAGVISLLLHRARSSSLETSGSAP